MVLKCILKLSVEGFVERICTRFTDLEPVLAVDLGSGLLDSEAPWLPSDIRPLPSWITDEPSVKQSIDDGADIVMFSGDKLLEGWASSPVAQTSSSGAPAIHDASTASGHPLVPLQHVLMSYVNRTASDDILFWKMASTSPTISHLAQKNCCACRSWRGARIVGGGGAGAAPAATLPSRAVVIQGDRAGERRAFVSGDRRCPVPGSLRSVDPSDDDNIAQALAALRVDMAVIATAGHIDHGKSALVRAMTGIEPIVRGRTATRSRLTSASGMSPHGMAPCSTPS